MKFVLYTVCISPHQLPLMREMVRALGANQCRYIYTEPLENGRQILGWSEEKEPWLVYEKEHYQQCRQWLTDCEVLVSGIRNFDLFEFRTKHKLITIYSSERWFKPICLPKIPWLSVCALPGWIKMLHPSYLRMVWRFRKLLINRSPNAFYYFPISMNAARDVALICSGKTNIEFERIAGGKVTSAISDLVWQQRLRLWGYFVSPSNLSEEALEKLRKEQYCEIVSYKRPLRLLWVGRMLVLKNIDCIIEAVRIISIRQNASRETVHLTLIGDGPEKTRLAALADGLPIHFHPFVTIEKVRAIMRNHDLYVFSSNSFDGWGAVVSEALEEQMPVIASRESGTGATVLPPENTFACRDAKEIADRIMNFAHLPQVNGQHWSAAAAAKFLLENFLP